jgi:hypothetical protein
MTDYTPGITLYRVFTACLTEGTDKARLNRLESRLDSFNAVLTTEQKREFTAALVDSGAIPADSQLGMAIKTFNVRFKDFTHKQEKRCPTH